MTDLPPHPPGFVLLRPQPAAPSARGTGIPVVSVGRDLPEARAAALDQARASVAARGLGGSPRLSGETYDGGRYVASFDVVPDAVVAPAVPRAPARPAWVLVIPFGVDADGKVAWGRDSAWSRSWIAPVRRDGLRLVSITGDADDRDRLPPASLQDPMDPSVGTGAMALARKYGAPAVALLRLSADGTVEAWMWRGGGYVSDQEAEGGADPRETSVALLARMAADHDDDAPVVSSRAARPQVEAGGDGAEAVPDADPASEAAMRAAAASGRTGVDLQAEPAADAPGRWGFSLVYDSADPGSILRVRAAVLSIPGLAVVSQTTDENSLEIVGSWPGDRGSFEAALSRSGMDRAR